MSESENSPEEIIALTFIPVILLLEKNVVLRQHRKIPTVLSPGKEFLAL